MIAIPFSQKTTFDKDGKFQDRGADRNSARDREQAARHRLHQEGLSGNASL
jgi:hypothetical protein